MCSKQKSYVMLRRHPFDVNKKEKLIYTVKFQKTCPFIYAQEHLTFRTLIHGLPLASSFLHLIAFFISTRWGQ